MGQYLPWQLLLGQMEQGREDSGKTSSFSSGDPFACVLGDFQMEKLYKMAWPWLTVACNNVIK